MELILSNVFGILVLIYMIFSILEDLNKDYEENVFTGMGIKYIVMLMFLFVAGWGFLIPYILGTTVVAGVVTFFIVRSIMRPK